MRHRLRTLLILAMVAVSALAASARYLESEWFADLTGWHGGGGFVVEVFSRDVASSLVYIPLILFAADLYLAASTPAKERLRWFWPVWLLGYTVSWTLCNSALFFAMTARE
jgi:hypothetical protein